MYNSHVSGVCSYHCRPTAFKPRLFDGPGSSNVRCCCLPGPAHALDSPLCYPVGPGKKCSCTSPVFACTVAVSQPIFYSIGNTQRAQATPAYQARHQILQRMQLQCAACTSPPHTSATPSATPCPLFIWAQRQYRYGTVEKMHDKWYAMHGPKRTTPLPHGYQNSCPMHHPVFLGATSISRIDRPILPPFCAQSLPDRCLAWRLLTK